VELHRLVSAEMSESNTCFTFWGIFVSVCNFCAELPHKKEIPFFFWFVCVEALSLCQTCDNSFGVVQFALIEAQILSRPLFLNRRAAARYRALASIIAGRERFSWNLSF